MKKPLLALLSLAFLAGLALHGSAQEEAQEAPKAQEAFHLAALLERMDETKRPWHGFLDRRDLSVGIYRLAAGAKDDQTPHEHDEVYYVVEGRGTLTAGEEELACEPGSIVYVAKKVPHRFHDITEDLTVLVFFAKAG
jgi:mannose-6-phosphate isomerase-like protein (cupin superfamily)